MVNQSLVKETHKLRSTPKLKLVFFFFFHHYSLEFYSIYVIRIIIFFNYIISNFDISTNILHFNAFIDGLKKIRKKKKTPFDNIKSVEIFGSIIILESQVSISLVKSAAVPLSAMELPYFYKILLVVLDFW